MTLPSSIPGPLTVLELCAGAGGMAIGLELAGFTHVGLIDNDVHACETLRTNRPTWPVHQADLRTPQIFPVSTAVDLIAAGAPCPPFSVGGRQRGGDDTRDLLPTIVEYVKEFRPRAVLLENVPGLVQPRFDNYRAVLWRRFADLGYTVRYRLADAQYFGVPQQRHRFLAVAFQGTDLAFRWPLETITHSPSPTVGPVLYDLMTAGGWRGAPRWLADADHVAPTLVGGSKLHGGADLGPTRSRAAWQKLRVDGSGLADAPPGADFPAEGLPRLTLRMAARLQGFPDSWWFSGGKTAIYRQIGNALPPPVALAFGLAIRAALLAAAVDDEST